MIVKHAGIPQISSILFVFRFATWRFSKNFLGCYNLMGKADLEKLGWGGWVNSSPTYQPLFVLNISDLP